MAKYQTCGWAKWARIRKLNQYRWQVVCVDHGHIKNVTLRKYSHVAIEAHRERLHR